MPFAELSTKVLASKTIVLLGTLGVIFCLGGGVGHAETFSGSGFVISDAGAIVTNAHVVEGCNSLNIPGYGAATVITADKTRDLAVVQIAGTHPPTPARIHVGKLNLGQAIVSLGFPLSSVMGDALQVSPGVVSSLSGFAGDGSSFTVSANVQPGNSGGPILNMRGEVVGVAQSKLNEEKLLQATGTTGGNLGFAIGSDTLAAFLLPFKSSISEDESTDALTIEDVVSQAKLFVVQIVCQTTPVAASAGQPSTSTFAPVASSGPSFDCSRVTKADEKAICSDPTLAQLDRATTDAFNQARSRNRSTAISTARAFLALRSACNFDVPCIQKLQYDAVAAFSAVGASTP